MSSRPPRSTQAPASEADSTYAWLRLAVSLLIASIGGVGLWSVVVVLPLVEAEFGVARAGATLPYAFLMIGFAAGNVLMGRLSDRFGVTVPLLLGALALAVGYSAAGLAQNLWQFILAHALLIGFVGSSSTFGPVIADVSRWFNRNRGIAVAIAACGSYTAGAAWPPIVQHFADTVGWRQTHIGIGIFCLVTILPLSFLLRRAVPVDPDPHGTEAAAGVPLHEGAHTPPRVIPLGLLQVMLVIAGIACCIAMAMPQVHIVALCADLGYGTARGAQMLSLMLFTGIISRLIFGWLADRIGPLPTLLTSSALQAASLLLFLPFQGLGQLFVVSALFGLAQGGIVPTYAMVVREYFPQSQAGVRIGLVLSATLIGMAIGGWMSGAIYDRTLSYELAFVNGFLWNLLNLMVVGALFLWLPRRPIFRPRPA